MTTAHTSTNGITREPTDELLVVENLSKSYGDHQVLGNINLTVRPGEFMCIVGPSGAEKAMAALAEVGLKDHVTKYPWQLSGGLQQRVAIARALAYAPAIVLIDEPFASVDAQTRADLEDLTLKVKNHLGITILLVTHDIDEAVYMSDRVLVLGKKPTQVVDLIETHLGTDRDQITTKATREFAALRSRVYQEIRHGDIPSSTGASTAPAGG